MIHASPELMKEVDRIKDRLRACCSRAEVEQVADEERENVVAMQDQPGGATQAIMISNLKSYVLKYRVP